MPEDVTIPEILDPAFRRICAVYGDAQGGRQARKTAALAMLNHAIELMSEDSSEAELVNILRFQISVLERGRQRPADRGLRERRVARACI